jgi:hypothetical protein
MITLGHNIYRERYTPVQFAETDRLRHMYMIGKTGVGKSTMFQNMCLQDIQSHHGVCFIDPHGESIDWLLARIPESRLQDVILFDPSDIDHPFGLNLLEARNDSEKDFLVAECIQIFYKLFDPEKSGVIGPQFEHWLRNAALTVMAGPDGGSLLQIPKLFMDKKYEQYKVRQVQDPLVREFWTKQMATTSDFHRSEMLNYFTSKFGHFLNNAVMRNIIGQAKSAFRFEDILAQEKIVLINLSKGKIGDLNAQMLGLILIAKLQAAVMARAGMDVSARYPFYLYVDEFHNVVTDTFTSMLSESRKYGLGVHLTNQYFSQLPAKTQDAILGNVGTLMSFEIGVDDAASLEKEFSPFTVDDFLHLQKFNYYLKLMINGKTSDAFSGISLPPIDTLTGHAETIKTINRLAYGYPRELIEELVKQQLRTA